MDLPVGPLVPGPPAIRPLRQPLHGRYTSAVPVKPGDAEATFAQLGGDANGHRWTYMLSGPFVEIDEWSAAVESWSKSEDPFYYTIFSGGPASDPASEPAGFMAYLNICPDHRRTEIGSIILGDSLRQTRAATEAFYLLIKHAFEDLDNLRVEWKANNLNQPSLSAAERLGFVFEGVFRNHMIIKGRRRDTAWYSITDEEWPLVKQALEAWLSADNFDAEGKQQRSLKAIRASLS